MIRLGRNTFRALLGMSLAACAARTGTARDESLQPLPGCPGRVGEADGTVWQEVQAEGFSVCVPADWSRESGSAWQGDGGKISWASGTGERRPFAVASSPGQSPGENCEATERIGGTSAKLRRCQMGSSYFTSATWQS